MWGGVVSFRRGETYRKNTGMNIYWLIAEAGILLEIVGAMYIVLGSWRARRQIDRIFRGIEGLFEIRKVRDILQNQARMELNGFLFLSSGLIMQFVGGFGG